MIDHEEPTVLISFVGLQATEGLCGDSDLADTFQPIGTRHFQPIEVKQTQENRCFLSSMGDLFVEF